jgi:release factor glutamine methyltransferase
MIGKTPTTTINTLLIEAAKRIERTDAAVLLAHVLNTQKAWLVAHRDDRVPAVQARKFRALVDRRAKHEPVAHLTNHREFYGRPFFVSRNVLIPRPETELLVDRALAVMQTDALAWDVGTGSGAIAVTLAKERTDATVLATDVSSRALTAAKQNAKRNHAGNVTFLKSDLLQPAAYRWLKKHAKGRDLVIAANLPYLPASDKKILAPDVVKYEPSLALFSGADGLTLIKRFLGQLARHLPEWQTSSATILFEFDPPQAAELKKIAHGLFPHATVTVHRDLAKRNRLLEIAI